jgi:hypothetical protein
LNFFSPSPGKFQTLTLDFAKMTSTSFPTHFSLPLCYLNVFCNFCTEVKKLQNIFVVTLYGLAVTAVVIVSTMAIFG